MPLKSFFFSFFPPFFSSLATGLGAGYPLIGAATLLPLPPDNLSYYSYNIYFIRSFSILINSF